MKSALRHALRPDEAAEVFADGKDLAKAIADLVGVEGRW